MIFRVDAVGGGRWITLGSQAFVDRIRREFESPRFADEVPRTLEAVDDRAVLAAVGEYFEVDPVIFVRRGGRPLGSVGGRLVMPTAHHHYARRFERHLARDPKMNRDLAKIEAQLAKKTKNKV